MYYYLANIVRNVSRSYCGSEISDMDVYSPYSFYGGSEAGTEVSQFDLHDSWAGGHQVKKPKSLYVYLLN